MALSQEKKGTIAVSLTNFLDSGCIVASGVALAAWAIAFNFDNVWVSILGAVGANAFGAAVGALIGGFLADRFGRKFIYTYNLLVYATGVFLIMCALNLPMLCAGIVISGLSVGAGVPSSWSYISEMSSSTSRAANIGISQFAWSCGPAVIFLIALLFSFVFPTFGPDGALLPAGTYGPFDGLFAMRLLFLILFVVALIAWNLQRKLEESKDWTEKQDAAAGKSDTFIQMMGRALTNSVNVKSIVFLVAVYLTWNIVAGTMGQFMPYMTISLLQAVMWILTAVGSLAIFSKFGDKIPHRILFAATAVMALAAWVVMVFFGMQLEAGTADSWGWLLWVFVALWGISAGFSAQCFYALWSTELFPTLYRGGVQGIMFFLVRGVLGIWSLVAVAGLGVETPSGFVTAGIIMCGFLLVSLVVGVIWCPNTQGRTLDEITEERYGKLLGGRARLLSAFSIPQRSATAPHRRGRFRNFGFAYQKTPRNNEPLTWNVPGAAVAVAPTWYLIPIIDPSEQRTRYVESDRSVRLQGVQRACDARASAEDHLQAADENYQGRRASERGRGQRRRPRHERVGHREGRHPLHSLVPTADGHHFREARQLHRSH